LGETEAEAGKTSDAEQTFNKLVAEYPESAFAADARKELDQLKKGELRRLRTDNLESRGSEDRGYVLSELGIEN
jgi:TolA-binding protein